MYIPQLQVRANECIVYDYWAGPRKPHGQKKLFEGQKAYSGKVTKGSEKRLRKAISLLVQKSPKRRIWNPVIYKHHDFRIGFVTLTIADQGNDTAADVYKKALAPFLRNFRAKGMQDYVWKAELQERGTLHYHIAVNQFIHYQEIQDYWNKKQKAAGYLQKFGQVHGHFRPNSVDIHSIRKVSNIEGYLTKYMCKTDGDKGIVGKVWDASRNLKVNPYYTTELTPNNLHKLRAIARREVVTDNCAIFRLPPDSHKYILDPVQLGGYNSYILSL